MKNKKRGLTAEEIQRALEADIIFDGKGRPVWPETQEQFARLYLTPDAPDSRTFNVMLGLNPWQAQEVVRLKRARGN
jgi:hypothetical protein